MTGHGPSNRRSDAGEAKAEDTAAADITRVVRELSTSLKEGASEQATALTRTIRERGQNLVDGQKSRAAAEIMNLGAAVRRAADKLHDQNSEALARYVDTAAESLDGVARYVEESDLTDLAREVEQFARRRPALIVGGVFLAGLALGRFVKAGQTTGEGPTSSASSSSSSRRGASGERSDERESRRSRQSPRPRKA